MAYAIFSPTGGSHSGFDDISSLDGMYDQQNTSTTCAMQVAGNKTGTITLTGLKQVGGFGGLSPTTMPKNAIVSKIVARVDAFTMAVKDPTCTIRVRNGDTVLATNSSSSWGSMTSPKYLDASVNIDTSLLYGYSWVEGLNIQFIEKGNYSLNTSKSIMGVLEIYLIVYWKYPPSYTVSTAVQGEGTVSGGGSYEVNSYVTLTATPKTGYKFVKWSDGNTNASRTEKVTGNVTYTAIFEPDKVNKIYVGTSQPKSIYVGTKEVKAVYVGTTKVYG